MTPPLRVIDGLEAPLGDRVDRGDRDASPLGCSGTTRSATHLGARLACAPPARKNRRRTRPTTTTRSPAASASAQTGASGHDDRDRCRPAPGRTGGRARASTSVSPDVRSRRSAARDSEPLTTVIDVSSGGAHARSDPAVRGATRSSAGRAGTISEFMRGRGPAVGTDPTGRVRRRRKGQRERSAAGWRASAKSGSTAAQPAEQLAGPGDVAGPLVEVGQGVGPPQVVLLGPLGHPPALLEQRGWPRAGRPGRRGRRPPRCGPRSPARRWATPPAAPPRARRPWHRLPTAR